MFYNCFKGEVYMLLINKMENANLTRVEEDIAQFIISHQEELEKLSTRAIAKETYTSSSAVIRLAHKLGFEGYNDLKKQYLEEQAYLNSHFQNIDANIPFSQDNNIMSVAGAIKEVMIESANYTAEYSVTLILDILYSCYFRLNYQKNLDYKIKHSKKVESTHFSSNEIIME